MRFSLVIGVHMLILVSSVWEPQALCARGAEDSASIYFEQKKYPEALSIWYGLVESGTYSAAIYYNIGLAESKSNHTDKAIMAFEKARRLKPFNHLIKSAILNEREAIENGVIPVRPFFLAEWYRGFLAIFRPAIWIFSGLLVALLAIMIFIRHNWNHAAVRYRKKMGTPLILLSAGLLFLLFGGLSYASLYRQDEGILHAVCEIRQAPSMDSPAIHQLFPGEKMIILDQLSGWYQVSLLNLEEGWISSDCLTLIEMGKP